MKIKLGQRYHYKSIKVDNRGFIGEVIKVLTDTEATLCVLQDLGYGCGKDHIWPKENVGNAERYVYLEGQDKG